MIKALALTFPGGNWRLKASAYTEPARPLAIRVGQLVADCVVKNFGHRGESRLLAKTVLLLGRREVDGVGDEGVLIGLAVRVLSGGRVRLIRHSSARLISIIKLILRD